MENTDLKCQQRVIPRCLMPHDPCPAWGNGTGSTRAFDNAVGTQDGPVLTREGRGAGVTRNRQHEGVRGLMEVFNPLAMMVVTKLYVH